VDGSEQEGRAITLVDDGQEHTVLLRVPRA
jgi:hypothetical protein